jgi:hypothetical protein
MRSKLLSKLFIALPILAISMPAFAGYQVTSQAGDSAAAEVVAGDPQNPAEFLVIAQIGGNAGAVTVGLVVNGAPATATISDDFDLSFPSECSRDGGAGVITFSATPTGDDTYDLNLGGFNAGGGGAVGGSATFTCTVTVNAVDDFIDEDSESLNLTIVGSASIVKDPLVQNFNISDNDTAALVATDSDWNGTDLIVLNQKLTNESGGTATFWVELATEPLSNITVDLAVSDTSEALISSGGSGDVGSLSLTFTPQNWNTGQQVTITGQDDAPANPQDGNIAYTVSIATTDETDNKYDNLSTGPVNGVNEDNDIAGQLRFTQSAQSGDEGAVMTLTVERINGTSGVVTVDYAITETSVSSSDYTDTTNPGSKLTFDDGEASQSISITLVDDDFWEPADESLSVALSNVQGGADLLTPDTQVITINPSDPIEISISASNPDPVPEGNAGDPDVVVGFTVDYTGGDLESPMTISWMTVDGTALGGSDFDSVGATDIDLPTDGDPVAISVNVNGDDLPEGNESFTVQLSQSYDLVTLAGGGSSVVTIEDDDAPEAGTFSITSIVPNPVMESAGEVTVTVTRVGDDDSDATINFATSNGSAIEPGDYDATNGSLVWEGAGAADDFKTFTVAINDDEAGEPNESFTVTITPGTADPDAEVIGIGSLDVTILADPTVGFSPTSYNVSEDGTSVTVFVTRANVDDQAVSVDFTTNDDSATAGEDYTTTMGTLDWGAAELGAKSIEIPIIADIDEIGPEAFTVDLSNCVNCTITGGAGQATVNIAEGEVTDPTPGTLAFNPTAILVSEATGNAGLLVTRTGGTDGAVTVGWTTVDGTAQSTPPADFEATSSTLSWNDGEGGSKLALVPVIDDDLTETTESFTVMFVVDSETGTEGLPTIDATPATVSIADNDSDEPGEFSVFDINVGEGDGTINVTVSRDGGSTGAASVDFATADGTALAGLDYTATNGTLNWADGDASSKSIPIDILDDIIVELGEAFTVNLSNASGATIADGSATVGIFDNDGGGNFTVSDVTVFEIDREATVTVTRTNDNNSAAFIFWQTINGTAQDENGDNDYKYADGELVWAEGDTSSTRTITIDIVPDAKEEGDEWFTVSIVGVQGDSITVSKPDGVVTIKDPIPIPTLSQWAMGLLVLLLLGMGSYSLPMRKRSLMNRK